MQPILLTDTVSRDLDRALHYALMWGHEGLALRTMGAHGERVPYVNEAKLRRRLDEHEMPLVTVEPGLFEGAAADRVQALTDLGALEETAAFCRRFGCNIVVVGALAGDVHAAPEAGADILRRAGDLAQQRDLVLAVRNQADTACPDAPALATLLEAVGHPHVQAAWSPVEAHLSDGDPNPDADHEARAIAPHVAVLLVRDGERRDGHWEARPPGEGLIAWDGVLKHLRAHGFDGPLCLEADGEPVGPFGLHATTALIQLVRAQRSAERAARSVS